MKSVKGYLRLNARRYSVMHISVSIGCMLLRHEQYVVVTEGNRKILISGCAHNGILNILGEYERKYGSQPDAVISGFHLMKKSGYTDDEITEIIDTAKRLKEYRTTFYTCHCTGIKA